MKLMAASFLLVGLRSTQQLNVMHHRYLWIIPVSYGMAACEVFLFGTIAIAAVEAQEKFWLIIQIGSGAGIGAICAMFVHKWMREKK